MADLYESIKILREACKTRAPNWINISPKVKSGESPFPPYTPEELVHASGMIPIGGCGAGGRNWRWLKSYLPAFACPIMQADMEFGLKGPIRVYRPSSSRPPAIHCAV